LTNGIATASLETPKVQDPCFKSVRHVLCATNALSVAAAGQKARELGYEVVFWDEPLCGEAKDAAKLFAEKLMTMAESHSGKICLIAGGETTVTLGNNPGLGGRNQEFALACAEPFANRPGITIASVGTDGSDGPTDAAGAIVDGTTIQRARDVRLDAHEMLKAHNAYPFFKEIGDLVVTGPTGTNVMDIQVGLIDNRE
jgi:glycerate-2-kinase